MFIKVIPEKATGRQLINLSSPMQLGHSAGVNPATELCKPCQ